MAASNTFEAARVNFLATITEADRVLLSQWATPDLLVAYAANEEEKHYGKSYSRQVLHYLQPTLTAFKQFGKALDVLCNAKPEVLALLWGGMRVMIHLADRYSEYFSTIREASKRLGESLLRVRTIDDLFSSSENVKSCLSDLYVLVLRFCLGVSRVFQDAQQQQKKRKLPRRLHIAFEAMSSAFKAENDQLLLAIDRVVDRLDKEALVANYIQIQDIATLQASEAAESTRSRQTTTAAFDKLLLDVDTSRKHYDLVYAQLAQLCLESDSQARWMQIEQQCLDDQTSLLSKVSAHVSEEQKRRIIAWLQPADPEDHHTTALESHSPDTCTWILDDPSFQTWLQGDVPTIWVNGIAGAGKTVLISHVIQHLARDVCPDETVAYFYFDHRETSRQNVRTSLATILMLLIRSNAVYFEAISPRLFNAEAAGRTAQINLLVDCIQHATQYFANVYIVFDALDECSDVEKFVETLARLGQDKDAGFKFLVCSRMNTTIQDSMADARHVSVSLDKSRVQPDITTYVRRQLRDLVSRKKLLLRDASLEAQLVETLSEKAEGMFQWAKCQLDQIRRLKTDKAIRMSLGRMPKGLNELYLVAFQRFVQDQGDLAPIQRLFKWLVYATHPLSETLMAQAIAVDFGQESFDPSATFTDPQELVKAGQGLISCDKRGHLRMSHFSVQEFLVSNYCRDHLSEFYMEPSHVHAELAQVCLTTLLFSDYTLDANGSKQTNACDSLYEYALSQWVNHFNTAESSKYRPLEAARSLLGSVNPNFAHMRSALRRGSDYLPVHFCAEWGLLEVLTELVKDSSALEATSEPYGSPICFAARHDQIPCVEYLVDVGADMNSSTRYSSMALPNNCLHWALDEDHVSIVSAQVLKYIAEHPDLDVNGLGGSKIAQRPLHYAARADRTDLIEVLLVCGATIDAVDDTGKTPLNVALEEKARDAAMYLLDQGASINRHDACNSLQESGFGFSTIIPKQAVNDSMWEAYTSFRARGPRELRQTGASHWGLALGDAVQSGDAARVQTLLDDSQKAPPSTLSSNPSHDPTMIVASTASPTENESKAGAMFSAMFSAIDLALRGRQPYLALAILDHTISSFEQHQSLARMDSTLDIPLVFIHDRPDLFLCECHWLESHLFLSMVLGLLRVARSGITKLAHGSQGNADLHIIPQTCSNSRLPMSMQIVLHSGACSRCFTSISANQPGIQIDASQAQAGASTEVSPGLRVTPATTSQHETINSLQNDPQALCEEARALWRLKRNVRQAVDAFITRDLLPGETQFTRCDLLGYMTTMGYNLNSLDRTGRTVTFWAMMRSWDADQAALEALGSQLYASDRESFARIRRSVIDAVDELQGGLGPSDSNSFDLTRKFDWDHLGRYLLWAGDRVNACKSFEAGTTFDLTIPGDFPASHWFMCDRCHVDYVLAHLLRGPRTVPEGLPHIDLCVECAKPFGSAVVTVPSKQWVDDNRLQHEEQVAAFADITSKLGDASLAEASKRDLVRAQAIKKREEVVGWLKGLKGEWNETDTPELYRRYVDSQVAFKAWLVGAGAAIASVKDLQCW